MAIPIRRKNLIPVAVVAIMLVAGISTVVALGGTANDNSTVVPTPHGNGATPVGNTIDLVDFAIEPNDINIHPGETLTFVNRSPSQHDITVDGQPISAKPQSSGQQASWTFDKAGTYSLVCRIHPNQMTATVHVK